MVTTIHTCAKCGSAEIRRNGHSGGHARYQCKACGYQARFVPAAVAKAAQYVQVEALLVERNSQRSIARVTGVARMTIAKRLKKSSSGPAAAAPAAAEKGARNGKSWSWMSYGALWGIKSARSGCGSRSSVPGNACGLDAGQPGAKPRYANSGRSHPAATTATVGILPTSGKHTPRCCPAGSIGLVPRAKAKPASSKPSIAPCASAVACSCVSPVRSANPWPCMPPESK